MKKTVIILAAAMLSSGAIFAQTETAKNDMNKQQRRAMKMEERADNSAMNKKDDDVSGITKSAFRKDFGNVYVVGWERKPAYDAVQYFTDKGVVKNAYYDPASTLIGTTETVKFSSLPEAGQKAIKKDYSQYKVDRVVYFKDNDLNSTNLALYETPFDDANNYFVELSKGDQRIVVKCDEDGAIDFFTTMRP